MTKFRLIPYAVLTAGLLAAGAGAASAQSMSSIDAREAQQQERIHDGLRDGSLTRGEARRLEQGEQRIQRYEARARADGVVTQAERQRLDRMLDREGHAISRDVHNDQRAWGRHEGWDRYRHGWDHRHADRRDFGRDHNNGSWNEGREHNGWNRDHNNTASNGAPHQWNGSHNGTGTTPGTGTTTPGTGTHSWNGSHSGGTTAGTTTGTTTGGQTRTASAGTATRSYSGFSGGRTSGGHR